MRTLAFVFLPALLVLIGVPTLLLSARRTMRMLDRHLAGLGIIRLRARQEREHCRAGVVRGVGVRIDLLVQRKDEAGTERWWQVVRASRDLGLVHAGLELPAPLEPPSREPRPQARLDPVEAERAARAALTELPQEGVELERRGDLVEARVAADVKPYVIARMIDVVCAWVDDRAPPPAPTFPAVSQRGDDAAMALLVAIPVAFAISSLATVHSDTIGDLLEYICDRGDKLIVFHEHVGGGTGYDVYCVTPTGDRYGCGAIAAAGFDLAFPLTYAALFVGLVVRRRGQKSRGGRGTSTGVADL